MSFNFFSTLFFLLLPVLQSDVQIVEAQQAYVNNHQLDCGDVDPSTKGNLCNGLQTSCQSYITFRSNPPYNSPAKISNLLGSQAGATLIASMNNISSDVGTISTNKPVVIPVNCSCYKGLYYQHNASYVLKDESENYFTLANITYQGLTTCQALSEQNPYDLNNLYAGLRIHVPLRCACPTSNQTALGVKYIITYLVTWGDYISKIAELFNASEQIVLDANQLLEDDLIYPFTPILVPVSTKPSIIELPVDSPLPARPPQIDAVPVTESTSSRKWLYVGIGIGASLLVLVAISLFSFWYFCRQSNKSQKDHEVVRNNPTAVVYSGEILNTIESLLIYKLEDIQTATGCFSEENRIEGSVYKGSFKDDHAAVKVITGDVSKEINMLKNINHGNIIKLSGFCIQGGITYLVHEYAENGSLDNWLHPGNDHPDSFTLSWYQRLKIAYNVADALNYLHNYMTPPCIHKNLSANNILLDSDFRAKIANFGLARELADDGQGAAQLTRHVIGTHGYMAPEYIENGLITPKLDVFAYGVVILELLSGKKAATIESNGVETTLCTSINKVLEGDNVGEKVRAFIDPRLREDFPLHLAFSISQLAKTCVACDPNDRPSLLQVFMIISKIMSSAN